jgi:two-component sensor histidine kinase
MKKLLFKTIFVLLLVVTVVSTRSQESGTSTESVFKTFQQEANSEQRLDFFFGTHNRYRENSAYDWLDKVNLYLVEANKKKDSLDILNYMLMQSQVYHDLGDYDKSLAISKELYQTKEQLNLKTKSILLDLMDNSYAKLKFYAEQIEIRKEKRKLGITKNVSYYDIYSALGFYRKAMDDYYIDEKKNVDDGDFYGQAVFYNNVGNFLRLDKSTPTALSTYKKAEGFLNVYLNDVTKAKTDNRLSEAQLLKGIIEGNIGKCHTQLKQYKEALPYLERSIETIKEYNKGKVSSDLVENSLEIADCYLQLNDFQKATDYLSDNLNPVKIENVIKRNSLFAAYYDKTQDYANAVFYLKKNQRINDSLGSGDSSIKLQQLRVVVGEDLENTRTMVQEQRQALEASQNEMIAKDERNNLVFISLVFTLLGFAAMVYAYLRSIKNQRLIAEQKHIIENSLVEKDSLLKEIHHRVKNNLQMVSSLLSLQTKNTRSKAAIEALEEGKSRVKAMALIHQKLYQNEDLSVIEMQGYIESLINSVQSVYKKGGHNINITIDAEDVELDIDRAIPFGLILNELVSNSFKYAFPTDDENGKIYIHIRKIGNQEGFFEYTDNGVGLPEDTEERANSSMGIRLMNRLANQLQTKLNVDKTTEGVRFWFNFK